MAYLITKDYQRVIQTSELNQITSKDESIRKLVEGSVEKEIRAYLIQKYDLTEEFQDTQLFSPDVAYKANDRVYLDAPAYNSSNTYALKKLTLFQGEIFICTTAITSAESFTASKWTKLGAQYDLFYVKYSESLFSQIAVYKKGDKVSWDNKVFTALGDSFTRSHESDLQALSIENVPRGNVVPGTGSAASIAFWGTGTPYALTAGTLPTDTAKWISGDNRNQLFVSIYLDMVVYELCKRIAPGNVPEARHNAWTRAMENLRRFAKGDITAELPILQPKQGAEIRYGGDVKRQNNY